MEDITEKNANKKTNTETVFMCVRTIEEILENKLESLKAAAATSTSCMDADVMDYLIKGADCIRALSALSKLDDILTELF